jgi:hypothetical protein
MIERISFLKYCDSKEDFLGLIIIIILVAIVHFIFVVMLWCGIRSILKKTLNLPPSRRKWYRTRADVIQDEESEECHVRYYFEYKEYNAKIKGYTVYGDKAMIYVKRKEPTEVKEFVPYPPIGIAASLSCLFIAGMILLFVLIILFG